MWCSVSINNVTASPHKRRLKGKKYFPRGQILKSMWLTAIPNSPTCPSVCHQQVLSLMIGREEGRVPSCPPSVFSSAAALSHLVPPVLDCWLLSPVLPGLWRHKCSSSCNIQSHIVLMLLWYCEKRALVYRCSFPSRLNVHSPGLLWLLERLIKLPTQWNIMT